jgi:hypothetical protein
VNVSCRQALVLTSVILLSLLAGCGARDITDLDVARARIDPVVFDEGYSPDVYPQAFSGTDIYAASIDSAYAYNSRKSLKVVVPGRDSLAGAYAGGVLTASNKRDAADFNALTFYARSSVASTLNLAGFGNDNTGNSPYEAGRANIPLTTAWTFVVVPVPSPAKLIAEQGLFTFAEGWEAATPAGHTVWFDNIRFANLTNITNPRPSMNSINKQYFIGSTATIDGTRTTFSVDGADVVVSHLPGYFDYTSSNPAVAVVRGNKVQVIGTGAADITATLDGTAVTGSVTLSGYVPPTDPAPAPTLPATDVIALLSDTYPTVTVDTWNPHWQWSTTQSENYVIAGNNNLMYTTLNFVGIEFKTSTIDATAMTHLHLDVYAPVGSVFKVKLVAFNANNGYMTGQAELTFDAASTPAFASGAWTSLDIPLADFPLTVATNHLAQLVLSTTDAPLVLVDNIYFHR